MYVFLKQHLAFGEKFCVWEASLPWTGAGKQTWDCNIIFWHAWPVGWTAPCKLRKVVAVEWMEVWSGCQGNVRSESYIPWRWFSDNPGFQQVDEKLYYSNSASVTGIVWGLKLTQEYYLISKSKHHVPIDGMKLFNPVDFEWPFEIICINKSDVKIHWVHFWLISTSAYFGEEQMGKY